MSEILRDEYGEPIVIGGVALPWHRASHPLAELGGRREIVRPCAADRILARLADGAVPPTIDLEHDHRPAMCFATGASARIEVWRAVAGLCFRVSDIAATPKARSFVNLIGARRFPCCSVEGVYRHGATVIRDGDETVRLDEIVHLGRITLCDRPAYSATVNFIVGTDPHSLGSFEAARLALSWHASVASPAARAAPANITKAQAARRDLAQVRATVQNGRRQREQGDHPATFSAAEWAAFGRSISHAGEMAGLVRRGRNESSRSVAK